jgi:hypothetical protein
MYFLPCSIDPRDIGDRMPEYVHIVAENNPGRSASQQSPKPPSTMMSSVQEILTY